MAKYLVTIESLPGLKPAYRQGVMVEAMTVREAIVLALDKAPRTGKFKHRARNMWISTDIILLGKIE